MNWLKRRLQNWLNSSDAFYIEESNRAQNKWSNSAKIGTLASMSDSETLSSEPLRLSIYRANGGTIVETRQYDRTKDRSANQLHIVGNDQDLGESLAKIITMESLRG